MKEILLKPIKAYQRISKFLWPAMFLLPKGQCRFSPTCSAYAVQAIKKHGIFRGVVQGVLRISRCHGLSKGGYDPVI